jgi:hypothetical protein
MDLSGVLDLVRTLSVPVFTLSSVIGVVASLLSAVLSRRALKATIEARKALQQNLVEQARALQAVQEETRRRQWAIVKYSEYVGNTSPSDREPASLSAEATK